MLKFLLLAALLPALCFGGRVTHHPCTNSYPGNTPAVPAWVEVEGCDEASCTVPSGRGTLLRAAFAPVTTHHRLRFWVRVFLPLGIEAPIPQPDGLEDACPLIDGGCPINAGQGETVAELYLQQEATIVGLSVRIEVILQDLDANNAPVVCGGVQVTLT